MYQKCDLGLFHKIKWIKKGFLTPADELYYSFCIIFGLKILIFLLVDSGKWWEES